MMTSKLKNVPEIMAPAGSFESLNAAIKAGADAVYFGVEQLNLRARSNNNFSLNEIDIISRTCRNNNVKAYLTLNTIIYDHDLSLMQRILIQAKNSNIDGVIASDHSAIAAAKKIGLPVHISTQANVCNIEAVEFYSNYADVIVLARELTLTQVQTIVGQIHRRKITGPNGQLVKIEIFAHGALCMAVSGKCYISLHAEFASANRGACAQHCRREYIVTDKESGTELEIDNAFIMSAKDLCTIDFLDKIMTTGISVLKIEGRGRSPEYVYTTTRCYKEAIRAVVNGSYTQQDISGWKEQLSTVYNRGFWDGYYLGKTIGEWSDTRGSKATERKVFLGKVTKYYKKRKVGEFELEGWSLKAGDDILITGSKTGIVRARVTELRLNGIATFSVETGTIFSMPVAETVRPRDKLYKIVKKTSGDDNFSAG